MLLIISFFNFFYSNNITSKDEKNDDFIFVYEEHNKEVIYDDGYVVLTLQNDIYKLTIGKETYAKQISDARLVVREDNIYLFYIDEGSLMYDIFNKKGIVVEERIVISEDRTIKYNLSNVDEDIFIYYNSIVNNQVNCYLFKTISHNKRKLSSGNGEEIIDFEIYDDSIYLLVKKEAIPEGLFGNGGLDKGLVIARFNKSFEIQKYITMDDEEDNQGVSISIINDLIYLIKERSIHVFSMEMESLNYKEIGNNYLITVGKKGLVYAFLKSEIAILSKISFDKESSISYPILISSIRKGEDSIIITSGDEEYLADVVDRRCLHEYQYIITDNKEMYNNRLESLESVFGIVKLKKKEYYDYYVPGEFGSFDVVLKYETKAGINFDVSIKENIPLECNLRDKMIYPSGYRIKFNGSGLINGNSVLSNYQLKDDGTYEVEITGNNVIEKYTIYVNHNQGAMNGDTNYVIDNYEELIKNEKFSVSFNLNRDLDIKQIISEGIPIESFSCKDHILTISFNGIRDAGYYYLYLDYFEYEETIGDITIIRKCYLDKECWYHISKDDITISNEGFLDDMSYSFDLIDTNDTARYIELELLDNSYNYLTNIPLGSAPIVLNGIPSGDYLLRAFVVYDTNGEALKKIELFNYTVRISHGDVEFGEIKVSKDSSRYTRVRIAVDDDFLKNNINEISYDKEVLYTHKDVSNKTIMIYSVMGLISSLLVGFGVRYVFLAVKKKEKII